MIGCWFALLLTGSLRSATSMRRDGPADNMCTIFFGETKIVSYVIAAMMSLMVTAIQMVFSPGNDIEVESLLGLGWFTRTVLPSTTGRQTL